MSNKNLLKNAGLTGVQAEIYEHLLNNGSSKASDIAKKIKRPRGVVYKGLDELYDLGLIEKKDKPNQVSLFRAEHPSKLEALFENQEKNLQKNRHTFKGALPDLVSSYNLIYNKPGIKYYIGVEGMKTIYDEILKEGKNFYLIRSIYEPVYKKEILPIVERFIKKRVAKNIKVSAITPTDIKKTSAENDAKWLMERFWVDKNLYNAPVEIDIFGDKIAILSFGNELIGMIIESKQIAQSLKQLFILAALGAKIKKSAENISADNNDI